MFSGVVWSVYKFLDAYFKDDAKSFQIGSDISVLPRLALFFSRFDFRFCILAKKNVWLVFFLQ